MTPGGNPQQAKIIEKEEKRQQDSVTEVLAGQSSQEAKQKRDEQAPGKKKQTSDWSML